MGTAHWWLSVCVVGILAAPCRGISKCLDGITINVILLEDEDSPWSLKFVKGEILKAIEKDQTINSMEGNETRNTTKQFMSTQSHCAPSYTVLLYINKQQNLFVDSSMRGHIL